MGGICESIVDGVTGHLVHPADEVLLLNRVVGIIKNPIRGAEMCEAARRFILEKYDSSTISERLGEVWARVIAESGH